MRPALHSSESSSPTRISDSVREGSGSPTYRSKEYWDIRNPSTAARVRPLQARVAAAASSLRDIRPSTPAACRTASASGSFPNPRATTVCGRVFPVP